MKNNTAAPSPHWNARFTAPPNPAATRRRRAATVSEVSAIVKSARRIMRQDRGTGSDELRILQLGWMLFFKIFCDSEKKLRIINKQYTSPIPPDLHWDVWAGNAEGITGDALITFVNELFRALQNIHIQQDNPRALLVREVFSNNDNYMKSGIHLRQVINILNGVDFNNSKDLQIFGKIYENFLGELQSAGTLGEFYTPRAITELMTALINPQLNEKILDPACGTGGFLTVALEHLKAQAKRVEQRRALQKNVSGWEYKPLPYLLANTNLILHDIDLPNIRFDDSLGNPPSDYRHKDRVDIILTNPPFGATVSDSNEKNFPKEFQTTETADLFLILIIHLLKPHGRAAVVLPDGSLTGDGVKERIRRKFLTECNLHTVIRLPNSVFQPYASISTNLLFFTKGTPTQSVWYWQHHLPAGYKAYSKTRPISTAEFTDLKKWWHHRTENQNAWQVSIDAIQNNGYDLDIKNPNRPAQAKQHSSQQLLKMLRDSFARSNKLLDDLGKVR